MRSKAFFLSVFVLIISLQSSAQKTKSGSLNNGIDRPKLVVGIVVDQMRWDYLYRYYDRYGDGGFKRLIKKGFSFDNTMIPYLPTVTAAGHTCLYTGSVPAVHGMVGNDWFDLETNTTMYCARDWSVKSVGSSSDEGKMSPKNMLVTTIGDELRLATNFKSRVYGIALKDRGGIMPAGHKANAAYWFDDSTGNWISSTYYMNALPAWGQHFNDEKRPDAFFAKGWSLLYDPSVYDQSTADDKPYERGLPDETTKTFPHAFTSHGGKNYFSVRTSPFGNSFTLDFAKEMIQNEKIGMSGQTDMLCISLSSTDYVVHRFGPQSIEAEDVYLRLDRDLEDFFNMLDETIGKDEYVLFLSADHGAPQAPGFMKEEGMPGGFVAGSALKKEMNEILFAKFKVKELIRNYYEFQFYLDKPKIELAGLDKEKVSDWLVNALMQRPEIIKAFDYSHFDQLLLPDMIKQRLANGYYPKRSGDVQFILKPQYTEGTDAATGTEHGAWYPYDSHIPLIFYGWGIKPGHTHRETYMTDVAPTIAAMLHIQMPSGCVGKVLTEIVN